MELKVFTADWCGPCTQQKELLKEYDSTPIRPIDIDEDVETANEYSVRTIPTMILLSDGEPVKRWDGLTQVDEIESAVEEHTEP